MIRFNYPGMYHSIGCLPPRLLLLLLVEDSLVGKLPSCRLFNMMTMAAPAVVVVVVVAAAAEVVVVVVVVLVY